MGGGRDALCLQPPALPQHDLLTSSLNPGTPPSKWAEAVEGPGLVPSFRAVGIQELVQMVIPSLASGITEILSVGFPHSCSLFAGFRELSPEDAAKCPAPLALPFQRQVLAFNELN